MYPAISLCMCGHESSAHLDFVGVCDGHTACDCQAFSPQTGRPDAPGPAAGSEGAQPGGQE